MNKLDLLRSFTRVTELASFTQAGASLELPRSTVSEHVQLLEDLLGARLLQRTTRRVTPTEEGLALYERATGMLAEMDDIENLFRRDDAALHGRVRVDMPAATARMMVLPELAGFCKRHPGLQIEISTTDRRVDPVREGFDCLLRFGRLEDEALVARPLGEMPLINCVSAAYAREFGIPATLDDLRRHRLIGYQTAPGGHPARFEYLESGKVRELEMPVSIVVNGTEAYEAACLGGLGIAQVPHAAMAGHLAARRLVEVLPGFTAAPLPVTLLYPHRRHLPRRVAVFMDWLADLVRARSAVRHPAPAARRGAARRIAPQNPPAPAVTK